MPVSFRVSKWRARAAAATVLAASAASLLPAGGTAHAATTPSPTFYFHGTPTDDANRAQVVTGATPTATFDQTAPTGTSPIGVTQTPVPGGNADQSANALSIYWYGAYTGTASGALYLDWYWSSRNAAAIAEGGAPVEVTVYADPDPLIATTNTKIADATVTLNVAPTPTLNHSIVPLSTSCPCDIKGHLLIQVTTDYIDAGHDNTVHYDSTAVPSAFRFDAPPAPPAAPGAAVAGTSQAFANYDSPAGFQTRDALTRPNSGEPSIGADWKTGNLMYMAGTQVSRIHFDTSTQPPTATWTDVTPAQLANASEDSILYTDSTTGRTWAEDFLVNPSCNANIAYTDNDGGSGGGPTGSDTNSSWTPNQCPYAEGPDHPSVGAGPYHGTAPATATYPDIVYYCSQNIITTAGAECTHSENGGLTWDPPTHIFGSGSPCQSIHGHIRVAPDGTMYVPQLHCGNGQGMAVTQDNGTSYTYAVVPDSTQRPAKAGTDPSVAADAANNVYFGYEDGSGHAQIAVSHDHGATWSPSIDASAPFKLAHTKFPEVIAGDAGRAAFAFLGTTTAGDEQSPDFTGVWDLYVSFTYDGGQTWQTVDATPNDPVQRGCIWNGGGSNPCRNLLDFNDITVDKEGRVYVAYTDGCTNDPGTSYSCLTDPTIDQSGCDQSGQAGAGVYSENASEYSTPTCTYGRQSAVVRQVCGQGLFASSDPGFFEGPQCPSPAASLPEAASASVLALGGVAALAVIATWQTRRGRRRRFSRG